MTQEMYDRARTLIDAANAEDLNIELVDGREIPKELLYSQRMSDMLERFKPETDNVLKLAIRAQHIQRWKSPRNAYPEGRTGYLQWRQDLYKFHAVLAGGLMAEAGYSPEELERVRNAIGKRRVKVDPDAQLLEDVASLSFIEHYLADFADKHPEYDEAKWIDIIRKTWQKMSVEAQAFALSGKVRLPESLVPLVEKAVAENPG